MSPARSRRVKTQLCCEKVGCDLCFKSAPEVTAGRLVGAVFFFAAETKQLELITSNVMNLAAEEMHCAKVTSGLATSSTFPQVGAKLPPNTRTRTPRHNGS